MRRSTARSRRDDSTRRSRNFNLAEAGSWYEDYAERLRCYLTRLLRSVHDAEDIAQEAFLHVLSAAGSEPILNPKALLFATAQNLLRDHCRRAHTQAMRFALQVDDVQIPDACDPSQVMESEQMLAQVVATLRLLRPHTRKAFLLDRVDLCSHAQIAAHLGVTVSMVEKHIRYAMDALETIGIEQPRHVCGRPRKAAA